MAIIIGPNQEVAPSKNIGEGTVSGSSVTGYKYGRDQMMQMVTWLKSNGAISDYDKAGIAGGGKPIILYSKKFAANGGFEDNADNQPFSMTSSRIYSEKWHIWVITDDVVTETNGSEKVLKWNDYGANAKTGSGELDLNEYYLYNVPSGQSKTLFAFTSVETKPATEGGVSNPTYGNFLDNVNFKIYRSLSGSTTPNGSAVIGSSDGSSSAEGAEDGHEITSDSGVKTYVKDGAELTIRSEIAAEDREEVTFAGVYCTIQKPDGSGVEKTFIPATDDGWTITEEEGKLIYTRIFDKVESAVDLHFVFVRSPRITYDSNGGKPYDCGQTEKADEADPANVYSFKPIMNKESGELKYIDPYTSHIAEGQSDAWKFTGWMLFDSGQYYEELIPAVHKVAYSQNAANTKDNTFTVIKGTDSFKEPVENEKGKVWEPEEGAETLYSDKAPGLSFVAQWRWRQTFIPKTDKGTGFTESDEGGTVEVVNIEDSNPNYEGEWTGKGAKAYYAEKGETVTVKAAAKEGYTFAGWYDADGNRASIDSSLSYVETKEGINTYYAHFVKQYTQRYIRQIKENGEWKDLDDEDSSLVDVLDHTLLKDAVGTEVSSTASNNEKYSLLGWFDENGEPVSEDMLINNGKTIRYTVARDATYYARYAKTNKVLFKTQLEGNGTLTDPAGVDKTYGKLSAYTAYGVESDIVSSKAYPTLGYEFLGWYRDDTSTSEKITDSLDAADPKVLKPEVSNADEVTYYARFRARTDVTYRVEHHFRNWNGKTDGLYTRVTISTYTDGTTGKEVTPMLLDLSSDTDYEGYRYEKGQTPQTIKGDGSTVFRIYYIRDSVPLIYDINRPVDENITDDDLSGSMSQKEGYVGYPVEVGPQDGDTLFQITGYTFNGWNTEADGSGTAYSNGDAYILLETEAGEDAQTINPNVLYAQWVKTSTSAAYTVEHYKVSVDEKTAKRAARDNMSGEIGTTVTAAPKSYDGYTYRPDYNNGEMVTVASGEVTAGGGLVLKLYYTPSEDVLTYKAGGGVGSDVTDPGIVGQEMTVKNGTDLFTRAGYTFTGWKTPSGTEYAPDSTYTLTTGDDILIAQWSANTNTPYKVYHYLVSADGLSASLAKDGEENKTGKTGQTVWATSKEFSGYRYNANFDSNGMKTVASGVVAGDGSLVLNLYYIPNSNTKYTVEHYTVDAKGEATLKEAEELTGITGQPVLAKSKTYTGYNYDANYDSSGNKTVSSGVITGDGSLKLRLYYTLKDVTLTYHINDNTTETEGNGLITVGENKYGTTVIVKPKDTFTREGYTFTGWNTKRDGAGIKYEAGSDYFLGEDNHLYAQWAKKESGGETGGSGETPEEKLKDKLTYEPNGGVGEKRSCEYDKYSEVVVESSSFTREGYEFTGWNTSADGTGTEYQPGDMYTLTDEDDILYAQWEKKESGGETGGGSEGEETGGDDNGGSTGGETDPGISDDGSNDSGSGDKNSENSDKAAADEMAATGDNSHIMTGFALAVLSLIGIAGIALKRRRKKS